MIGWLMRLYRRSPMHPRMGRALARILSLVTRLRNQRCVVKTIDGLTYELDLSEVIDSSLYYSGTFEPHAERLITEKLQPGMTAIDIGANIGYHTFRMARGVGPAGAVVAIEPMSQAFRRLTRNSELNSFKNIRFIQAGLSDADYGLTDVAFQANYRLDGRDTAVTESVPIRSLDSLVSELGLTAVDFIKMDVDGYEGKVLRGAHQTLEHHRPALLFEVSPTALRRNGDDLSELVTQLQSLGYRFRAESGEAVSDLCAYCAEIPSGLSANVWATTSA